MLFRSLKSFSNNKSLDNELMNKTKKFGETSKAASRFKAKQLSIFVFLLDIGYLILLVSGTMFVLKGNLDVLYYIIHSLVVISASFTSFFLILLTERTKRKMIKAIKRKLMIALTNTPYLITGAPASVAAVSET